MFKTALKSKIAAAVMGVAAASFAGAALADTVVKVGMILPMSGAVSALGESINHGAALYHKLHKDSLPKDVKIDVILRDDGGSSDNIRRIAQEMVIRDRVKVLAGGALSPQVSALAPLITEAKVPLVVMNGAKASLTRESPYMIRTATTLWQTSYTVGEWAAKSGQKKAYTLVADYAAGLDAEEAFIAGFTKNGGTIVGKMRFPVASTDFLPYMQAVKDSGAGTIFGFVNAGRVNGLVNAVAGSGLNKAGVKLIGPGDMAFDDELAKMNPNVAGMITAGVYYANLPTQTNKEFVSAWKKEYGNDSIPSALGVFGWDGMAAIYDLVRTTNGKFDADTAMKFLSNWKNPNSPRGPIAIDPETRDIVQTLYINRAELVNGKPTNVNMSKVEDVKDPWKRLNPAK